MTFSETSVNILFCVPMKYAIFLMLTQIHAWAVPGGVPIMSAGFVSVKLEIVVGTP